MTAPDDFAAFYVGNYRISFNLSMIRGILLSIAFIFYFGYRYFIGEMPWPEFGLFIVAYFVVNGLLTRYVAYNAAREHRRKLVWSLYRDDE